MLALYRIVTAIPMFLLSLDIGFEGGTISPMAFKHYASLSALLVVAWSTVMRDVECATQEEVEKHLEMGKKLLAAGQMADALSHYHAAVEGDPSNYMSYYKRATVYLALGKSKSALPDLDKVIQLKPDFTAARLQRANVKLKQGNLDDAYIDYEQVLAVQPDNAEAHQHLQQIDPLKRDLIAAKEMLERHDFQGAINTITPLIETCPWNAHMREIRAESYINQGDYFKAINDLRPTTKLRSDNTGAYFKISNLYYEMGEAEESLTEIRECLKLDPDHKECFPFYKTVKKLVKQMQSSQNFINEERWDECVEKSQQMLKTESKIFAFRLKAKSNICHCNSKGGHVKEAYTACNEVLEMDENNVDAICDRAEAYIADDMFDEAIKDYQQAENIAGDMKRVQEGLKRAQKLLKQSKKRDYYKILGVKRTSTKKQIIKAYRKLAMEWHPDKFPEGEEKNKAQNIFIDLAAAKEVLTDPEKREKFDNGEDPLDPEEQSQGGGPFWHQGFNPFGGGGFQFKFHFN